MVTFSTSTYQGEMPGYPVGEWQSGHFLGIRKLLVGWNERSDLLDELDAAATGVWPYADGPSTAICRRVRIEPLHQEHAAQTNAAGAQEAEYDFAVITAWYSTKGPTYYGGNLYNETIQPSRAYETVLPKGLKWSGGTALDDNEQIPMLRSGCTLVQHWPRVMSIPSWVLGNIDCVNANVYTSPLLGISFAAERLLYTMPSIDAEVTMGKLTTYSVMTRCLYRPVSWNYHWRATAKAWEEIYLADGTTPYKQYTPILF